MAFNYSRGNQLFINDTRVHVKDGENRIPIAPPNAANRWTVLPTDSTSEIFVAAGLLASETGKLDVIHLLAHGSPGFLQLGAEGLLRTNAKMFKPLRDKVRVIVMYGCSTGADIKPGLANAQNATLGGAVAAETNAKVIVGEETQYDDDLKGSITGRGAFLYGNKGMDGPIYICYPNGDTNTIFKNPATGKTYLDLESYIFSNTNH